MSHSEEEIAHLLATLPPAPEGWVAAAREIPRTRRELVGIMERIESDEQFRRQVMSDLDAALGPATPDEARAAKLATLRVLLEPQGFP